MQIVIDVALAVAALLVGAAVYDRFSSSGYWRAYDAAQRKDLEYARAHPDCSCEEAHRYRDEVMRHYGRY